MSDNDCSAFHNHNGILVEDPEHPNDLTNIVENVLDTVDTRSIS